MRYFLTLIIILSINLLFANGGPTINSSVPIPAIPLIAIGALAAYGVINKSKE